MLTTNCILFSYSVFANILSQSYTNLLSNVEFVVKKNNDRYTGFIDMDLIDKHEYIPKKNNAGTRWTVANYAQ